MTHALKTPDAVADRLRQQIQSGEWPDGARLVERDLAQRFSVSRVPLREAIQKLAHEGLVVISPSRGASVKTVNAQEMAEMFDLRQLLEGEALVRSVPLMTDAHRQALVDCHQRALLAANAAEQQAMDQKFHQQLYAPCGQTRLIEAIGHLRAEMARYERLQTQLMQETDAFLAEHQRVLDACLAGDAPAARRHLVEHLQSAQRVVLQAMGAPGV